MNEQPHCFYFYEKNRNKKLIYNERTTDYVKFHCYYISFIFLFHNDSILQSITGNFIYFSYILPLHLNFNKGSGCVRHSLLIKLTEFSISNRNNTLFYDLLRQLYHLLKWIHFSNLFFFFCKNIKKTTFQLF